MFLLHFYINFLIKKRTLREGLKKSKCKLFPNWRWPPPPSKCKLFDKNFNKKVWCPKALYVALRTYPNTFLCLKKSILEPLFTEYRLFLCKLWGQPPPLLEKVNILNFFAPFPYIENKDFIFSSDLCNRANCKARTLSSTGHSV